MLCNKDTYSIAIKSICVHMYGVNVGGHILNSASESFSSVLWSMKVKFEFLVTLERESPYISSIQGSRGHKIS